MTKYKVGDKVIIREDIQIDRRYGINSVNNLMFDFRGKIATILSIRDTGSYCIDLDQERWAWTDQMFYEKPQEIKLDIDGVKHTVKPEIEVIMKLLTEASRGSEKKVMWTLRTIDGAIVTKTHIEKGKCPFTVYAFRRKYKEEKK